MRKTIWRTTIVGATCILSLALASVPGYTSGAQVTNGEFGVFAAGTSLSQYQDIAGHAQMVRTADGRTIVKTNVTGLEADTTYGSHVHATACSVNEANGHYKHDPSGPGAPPNEIWPAFTTNDAGVGSGKDTAGWTARPEAQSVVVHAPFGAKIACADLS